MQNSYLASKLQVGNLRALQNNLKTFGATQQTSAPHLRTMYDINKPLHKVTPKTEHAKTYPSLLFSSKFYRHPSLRSGKSFPRRYPIPVKMSGIYLVVNEIICFDLLIIRFNFAYEIRACVLLVDGWFVA